MFATNGYFAHGYGMKAKGMGGVGIALAQDAMAAATNPAGMATVGNRIDFGLDLFMPDRTATWGANGFGVTTGDYRSGRRLFGIPEFAYNREWGKDSTLGVVVYGNGGMNTSYNSAILAGGTSNTYSNLEQLFIAPTWTLKLDQQHAVGVSFNIIRQAFEARGLQGFSVSSSDPANLTDRGQDVSHGWGLKFGWTGQVSPSVTLGAVYQTESKMQKFDKYKGLFAEAGKFNIPASFGLGIAVKASPRTTVAADVLHIRYDSIRSLNNPSNLMPGNGTLGTASGAGFGWRDMTVYKLGVSHQVSNNLTVRAGYNYGKQPIPNDMTYFNILAPATIENHLTLGATWAFADKSELTVSYMHAFNKKVSGVPGGNGGTPAGYPVDLKMHQNAIGVAYGWKM